MISRAEQGRCRAYDLLSDGLAAMWWVGDTSGIPGVLDTVAHLAAVERQGASRKGSTTAGRAA